MPRRNDKAKPPMDSWERERVKHYGAGAGNRHVRYGRFTGGCSHCGEPFTGSVCPTTSCLGNLEPRYVRAVEKDRPREADNLRARIERGKKSRTRGYAPGANLRSIRGGGKHGAPAPTHIRVTVDRRAA